jgi:RNA polymerase sigma-B factor
VPHPSTRDRLIEDHLPLVRSVARRFAGEEPLDDLVQVGTIGLIKAVDRFDAERGSELAPFAAASIAGEIRHHLRDRCAPVRVPRRLRAEGLRVRPVPLEAIAELAREADATAAADDRVAVETALRLLDARERHIVALRYFGGLSQAQIASRVGLSQAHVSRLLGGALGKLGRALDPVASMPPRA